MGESLILDKCLVQNRILKQSQDAELDTRRKRKQNSFSVRELVYPLTEGGLISVVLIKDSSVSIAIISSIIRSSRIRRYKPE